MYRQVLHFPEDYAYLCIFWRFSRDEPLQTYILRTVTYGTASAPYLATRVLKQLASDEARNFPVAAKVVERDFYVDDLFSGAATVTETIKLREQIKGMLSSGGFQLRKWASNFEAVLEGIPPENRALQHSIDLDRDQIIKTVCTGNQHPIVLSIKLSFFCHQTSCSRSVKRCRISLSSSIHWDSSVQSSSAKAFMKTLWTLRDESGTIWEWDRELPSSLRDQWINYHSNLPALNELSIDRYVLLPNSVEIELHLFSNASDIGYGACAYLRSVSNSGQIKITLLTSKFRIAPLKKQNTPRLELCGALLSAELYQRIAASLQITFSTVFWTDSTTVINWLKATPSTRTTIVANRVSKIHHATQHCSWNHIAGLENPADWKGPGWLQQEKEHWPVNGQHCGPTDQSNAERRKTAAISTTATTTLSFIDEYTAKFSSYSKMIRITAYWCRFFSFLRIPTKIRKFTFLTTDELKTAEHALIRLLHQQCFSDEWKRLENGQPVLKSPRLKWFHPMLSTNDRIIRIGSRLGQSTRHEDFKHPILLSCSHYLSTLLLLSYHQNLLHAAAQLMINTIRIRYWLLGGRGAAKQIVHKCVIWVRARPKLIEQFMSELPAARIVANLTTAKFLQAFRRFVSRRGICSDVYTDNGKNFVGAAGEQKHLLQSSEHKGHVARECTENGIRWHFNPPKGSHFGGLWEAAIKSAQKHFTRVLGPRVLAYDDMETLLAQIECCLNSRPLTPLSDDPSDLAPLTPGHFLVGSELKAVPDVNLDSVQYNRLTQWQQTQKMFQEIWNRWHLEYLATLQPRAKWCNPPVHIEKNRLVIIKEENISPMRWPTGRIHELHPGKDGVVRVVTLQTARGFIIRPIAKLCLLPVFSSNGENVNDGETVNNDKLTKLPEKFKLQGPISLGPRYTLTAVAGDFIFVPLPPLTEEKASNVSSVYVI
ncbi:uncharacterized protein LOC129766187 [Toxorhynchites rutilus septentrionalis]|uniref:uncharacterized protein LOC129766187 n=1 Tax=Toxorhynchites rutilus septentrionalis TaxID=329112 RepID=UPI0024799B4E|nr:uncharacterized protein LOC129766187 [Toxorhynchites rutilus septentrionalis]